MASGRNETIDILVLTALSKEWTPLRHRIFPELKEVRPTTLDGRDYYFLDMDSTDGASSLRVGFVCVEQMGRVAAALCARDAIHRLSPRYIILTGIAAVAPNQEYQMGDVVVPAKCLDYAVQKYKHDKATEYRVTEFKVAPQLHQIAKHVEEDTGRPWALTIDPDNLDPNSLGAHLREQFGSKYRKPRIFRDTTLACGDVVIASADKRDALLQELNRTRKDVEVIEMESTGIALATALQSPQGCRNADFLVVKGVCDFADENKHDDFQRLAVLTSGTFLRRLLETFLHENRDAFLKRSRPRTPISQERETIATLRLSSRAKEMLSEYPREFAESWRTGIDGAVEVIRCPTPRNQYGGFARKQISMRIESEDWPQTFDVGSVPKEKLEMLGVGLNRWLGGRKAQPNRICVLQDSPSQPVHDHPELILRVANSDYFCVRAITELARSGGTPDCPPLSAVFPDRWAMPSRPFAATCVPYHVSAQGVLIVTDPETHDRHLILCASNPQHETLATGWGATFAEQMWAGDSKQPFHPWWHEYVDKLHIEAPKSRYGDPHIQDTLLRGLEEEMGLTAEDIEREPLLLNVCIEEDMYFLTFIFIVEVAMDIKTFHRKWARRTDPEASLLAAYPIGSYGGKDQLDPAKQFAKLLAMDEFVGGQYLLPNPRSDVGRQPWHISSRMRIYAAGMHLCGEELLNHVRLED